MFYLLSVFEKGCNSQVLLICIQWNNISQQISQLSIAVYTTKIALSKSFGKNKPSHKNRISL